MMEAMGVQSRGAICLDVGLEKIVLAAVRKIVTGRRGDRKAS